MLPGNTSSTLVGNYIRAQQGVIDTVRVSADDLRLTVGEKVQALVTNQLNNGRFAVLIKDQLLDLNLPRNTQPGTEFELTVLSKDPQLTFRLNASAVNPSAAQLAPKDANVALSKGATMIVDLLKQGGQQGVEVLKQSQPLFSGKPDAASLAGQLAARLGQSGLFYESHQAEWVTGQRPLQALLDEPQAMLPRHSNQAAELQGLPKGNSNLVGAGVSQKSLVNADQEAQSDSPLASIEAKNLSQSQKAANELLVNSRSPQVLLDEKGLQQMVRQQLDLVENKPLIWQGQAWPGQGLRWELELENERQADDEVELTQQQWQTRLNLDLPRLGSLGVTAQLQQGQFKLRFNAASEATLQLLREQQPELMRRFESAGLLLVSTQLDRDDET